MVIKQHSFKADSSKPDEKMINDFLEGKPTQYHLIEAMKTYVRIENAKQAAIDNMIVNIQANLFAPQDGQAPQAVPAARDSIKEFDM
ncbi:hypothetical protein L4A40_26860 [Bacillus cereus]|uniref:hypothetical protein n=1 Tax=Bacillus cereus TaxID=1396 RepID=UPI001F0DD092|nr:hypothetical protein [Bacillus cereus]MCH5476708.1 hypothetical protein [Bacillus cereus]